MKSYIPRTLSSIKLNAHGTAAALMKHCLIWQWLHEVLAPGYSLWDQLGKLCEKAQQQSWTMASRMKMKKE
jgi:hypothetical protein